MSNKKVVKEWFIRLLADFRIYSPLYKVTVTSNGDNTYLVTGEVDNNKICVDEVYISTTGDVSSGIPVMYRGRVTA